MSYRTDGSSALAPDEDDYSSEDRGYEGDSAVDDMWRREAAGGFSSDRDRGKVINLDDYRRKRDQRNAAAGKALAGEKAASNGRESGALSGKNGGGIGLAKDAEGSGGFVNNVAGKAAATAGGPVGVALSKKIKKGGPFATILVMIGIIMGVFSASNSAAPFGLINNLMDHYNSLRTSMNTRSNNLMPRLIKGGKNVSIMRTTIFGKEKFKVNMNIRKKLLNNGVYYDPTHRIMVFKDENGKAYGVAADESSLGDIPDEIEIKTKTGDTEVVHIDADARTTYRDALDVHEGFFVALEKSTRTIKGHISGWFDKISKKFHIRIGNSRNRQKDTPDGASDDVIEQNARKDGMSEEDGNGAGDVNADRQKEVWDDDCGCYVEVEDPTASRNIDTGGESTAGDPAKLTKGMSDQAITKSLTARAKTLASQFGKAASILNLGSIACAGFKIINALIQTITALQRAGILNFGTGFFEVVQKTQSGDSSTELHTYMKRFNEVDPKSGLTTWQSKPINQAFADGKVLVGRDDNYVKELDTSDLTNQLLGADAKGIFTGEFMQGMTEIGNSVHAVSSSKATYNACVDLQIAGAVVGLAADLANAVSVVGEAILAVPTGGLSVVITELFKWIANGLMKKVVLSAIIAGVTAFVTSVLVPKAAKILARDLIGSDSIGPLAAYAIDDASNMYMGRQMQNSSGVPGTEEKVRTMYLETQRVIADEARYIRDTRSPFDISTKYTFLGSIVNSVTPLAMSLNTPLSVISNTTSLVGSAIGSLLPTANAASVVGIETSLSHDCGSLSEITDSNGDPLICDAYGNPYFVTHMDTMGSDPADVMDSVACSTRHDGHNENFVSDDYRIDCSGKETGKGDSDKNPEIRERSELGKYIVACVVRDSDYGQEDARVSAYILGSSTIKDIAGTLIGAVPIAGNAWQSVQAIKEKADAGWITGENCVKDDYKHYSRYTEDQRWLESTNIIEESAVSVFLDKYYEQYPLDNSLEGIISQYSGLAYDDIDIVLGFVEYNTFLANYKPTDAGPMKALPATDTRYIYDSETIVATEEPVILNKFVVYDNLRDRSFVV